MSQADIERRIAAFLGRKEAEFPELAESGRGELRARAYAARLRASGQLPLVR